MSICFNKFFTVYLHHVKRKTNRKMNFLKQTLNKRAYKRTAPTKADYVEAIYKATGKYPRLNRTAKGLKAQCEREGYLVK